MWKAAVAHIVVAREGIKNILHSKVEKNEWVLELDISYLCFNWLVDSVLTKSDCTSSSLDNKMCSIEELMAKLHSINGINICDDFL